MAATAPSFPLTMTIASAVMGTTRQGAKKAVLKGEGVPDVYAFPHALLDRTPNAGDTVIVEGYVERTGRYQPQGTIKASGLWFGADAYQRELYARAAKRAKDDEDWTKRPRFPLGPIAAGDVMVFQPEESWEGVEPLFLMAEEATTGEALHTFFCDQETKDPSEVSLFAALRAAAPAMGLRVLSVPSFAVCMNHDSWEEENPIVHIDVRER